MFGSRGAAIGAVVASYLLSCGEVGDSGLTQSSTEPPSAGGGSATLPDAGSNAVMQAVDAAPRPDPPPIGSFDATVVDATPPVATEPRGRDACRLAPFAGGSGSCDTSTTSPFACVRYNEDCSIDVQTEEGGPWYGLLAIEGVCIESISEATIQFCANGEGDWKEGIAENTEEVMFSLEMRLGDPATLDLLDLETGETVQQTVKSTAEKQALTRDCWRDLDQCFSPPPGPFRPDPVPWPPEAEGQCDRVCAHLEASCPDQFEGFCDFACNYEADVAYSYALTHEFTDYVACCTDHVFTTEECELDQGRRFGFGDCDVGGFCDPATPAGATP